MLESERQLITELHSSRKLTKKQVQELSDLFASEQQPNMLAAWVQHNQETAILIANHIMENPNSLEALYPIVVGIIASIEKNEAKKLFSSLIGKKTKNPQFEEIMNDILFNNINEIYVHDVPELLQTQHVQELSQIEDVQELSQPKYIQELWQAQYISEALKYRKNITKLRLEICYSQEMLECFNQNLVAFKKIDEASKFIIGNESGARRIATALKNNKDIESLRLFRLFSDGTGVTGARIIADALINKYSLTKLELSQQYLRDDGAGSIAALLTQSNITELYLRLNIIQDKGVKEIATALANSKLNILDLSYNIIGNDGASTLANGLKSNSTLIQLKLACNNITGPGAESLFKALTQNTTLETLDLEQNEINALSTNTLNALKHNKTLQSLSLWRNKLDVEDAKVIATGLRENKGLTSLNLSENNIQDLGTKAIAIALEQNKTLSKLDLSGNQIGRQSAVYIGRALRINTSLTDLNLRYNQIGDMATSIVNALTDNTSLKFLQLDGNKIAKEMVDYISQTIKSSYASRVTPIECTLDNQDDQLRR